MSSSPIKFNRIDPIDAFRGFALAGIVIVHMVEQYIAAPVPEGTLPASSGGFVNGLVDTLTFIFIRGKFFALFALLFGLSFYLQMDRAARRGKNNAGRFAWRLILLFIIGYAHHLFYRGDILTIYAMFGFVLLAVYPISNKVILIIAGLIFTGFFRYMIFALNGNDPLFLDYSIGPDAPQILNYIDVIKSGSITEVFYLNATDGMIGKLEFQVGIFSRAYLTIAFFILGMWLGRIRFFERLEEFKPRLKKGLWWSIGLVVISFVSMGALFSFAGDPTSSWLGMLAFTMFDLHNLAFTGLLTIAFSLIYLRSGGQRFFNSLIPYGKTALTNYFLQSVIGTGLLYGWGLRLMGKLNNGWLLLIALTVIILQTLISKWWLDKFRYGPMEWGWRCFTDFKWHPFVRQKMPNT